MKFYVELTESGFVWEFDSYEEAKEMFDSFQNIEDDKAIIY